MIDNICKTFADLGRSMYSEGTHWFDIYEWIYDSIPKEYLVTIQDFKFTDILRQSRNIEVKSFTTAIFNYYDLWLESYEENEIRIYQKNLVDGRPYIKIIIERREYE